jgi:hypothetical protein
MLQIGITAHGLNTDLEWAMLVVNETKVSESIVVKREKIQSFERS